VSCVSYTQVTIDVIAVHEERVHRAEDSDNSTISTKKFSVLESKGYNCSRHAHENRWCQRKGFVDVRSITSEGKRKKISSTTSKINVLLKDGLGQ
jgi:hypothetical protein